jgi:hypothetical protein
MIKHTLFLTTITLINTTIFGCEMHRKAHLNDAVNIVNLIESHTEEDKNKIYILPKKFRLDGVKSAIEKNRLFVAHNTTNNTILGYKNIFLIDNDKDFHDVLEEMGCIGHDTQHIDTARFTSVSDYKIREKIDRREIEYDKRNTHIYVDMDYTHPAHRGRGINKTLTDIGLLAIKEAIINHIKQHNSEKLILLYGLSNFNDYDSNDEGKSRTPGIVYSFASFIHDNMNNVPNPLIIEHDRHVTFMPMYDEHATENQPLPKSEWIPSSGNTLSYSLINDK